MARYTITIDSLIANGYQVFDNSWNTFEPDHKAELCDKILRHYRFFEIGAETPARFRHYLNCQLQETMPYYNMLYKTALMDLMPLYNHYVETELTGAEKTKEGLTTLSRKDITSLQLLASSLKRLTNTDQTTDSTENADGTKHWTEDDTRNLTDHETTDTDIKENWSETTDKTKDTTDKATGTEDETTTGTSDKTGHSDRTQDSNGSTTGSNTQYHSDTPQGSIVNDRFQIDTHYLTTYDHGSQSGSSTDHLQEGIDTTEHTDDKTVRDLDTTADRTINETEHSQTDGEKTVDQGVVRDLTAKETINKVYDESWGENRVGNVHDVTGQIGQEYSDGKNDSHTSDISSGASTKDGDKSTKQTSVTKGMMGISRSELIRQYRETYLNIDLMIIESLASNFMGVF